MLYNILFQNVNNSLLWYKFLSLCFNEPEFYYGKYTYSFCLYT